MTNWEKSFNFLDNVGIGHYDVSDDVINYLKDKSSQGKPHNSNLIGHIKNEYGLINVPKFVEDYLVSKLNVDPMKTHIQRVRVNSKNTNLKLQNIWINYQKKYEFNPVHDHSGISSFIIFLQIPYNLKDEENVFPSLSGESHTSKLAFTLLKPSGSISHTILDVDKSFENKLLIFPASYHHNVYPFYTSDDYRITVAGILVLDIG